MIVASDSSAVRPYAPLLGSARLLYENDLDPQRSDPELVAWLLVLADWMAATGEVAMAAMRAAAWWLERTDAECGAFARAASASLRPDAAGVRAVAEALPWLRRLRHVDLRPAAVGAALRAVPGTGIEVPAEDGGRPPALVAAWERAATEALAAHRRSWRVRTPEVRTACVAWIRDTAPPVLVAAGHGRIVWDSARPEAVDALRRALADCDDAAAEAIRQDLDSIARVTRDFERLVLGQPMLPGGGGGDIESRGYVHLHPARPVLVYDLDESGMERRLGPPLPFEPEMVAARAAHELGHLADRAGWIGGEPPTDVATDLAAMLDDLIAAAPRAIATVTAADVADLGGPGRAGAALVAALLTRAPDWRANLMLVRLASRREREVYAWHNVRRLTREYPPRALWRLLVRYLYEYQYLRAALGLVEIADPWPCFDGVTSVAHDLVARGVVTREGFERLAEHTGRLFAAYSPCDRPTGRRPLPRAAAPRRP